jgi:hypothetical protein
MSAALIAAVFARSASACPPTELVATTASAGNLLLRGVPLEEVVSRRTAAIVRDILGAATSLGKLVAAAFLASGSVALAIGMIIWQLQDDSGRPGLATTLRVWSRTNNAAPVPAPVSLSCGQTMPPETVAAATPTPAGQSAPR